MQADPRTFPRVSGKRDHLSVETQPVGVTATIHVEAVWEHRRRIPSANSAAETPRRCHSLTASILGMPDASVVACFPRSRQPGGELNELSSNPCELGISAPLGSASDLSYTPAGVGSWPCVTPLKSALNTASSVGRPGPRWTWRATWKPTGPPAARHRPGDKPMVKIRDRKHPQHKAGNDQWVPLLGESAAIIERQPRDGPLIFPYKADSNSYPLVILRCWNFTVAGADRPSPLAPRTVVGPR